MAACLSIVVNIALAGLGVNLSIKLMDSDTFVDGLVMRSARTALTTNFRRVPFREVVNSQSNPSAVDSPDTIVQNRLEELRNPHAPAAINAALSILIMYKMACGQTAFNLHASYDAIGRDVTNFLGKEGYTGWYITGSSKKKTVSKPYKSSREVCYILFPECDTHCFCSHV